MNLITSSLARRISDNSKLFAERVQPKLGPVFNKWEHGSQPRSMADTERTAAPAYPAAE